MGMKTKVALGAVVGLVVIGVVSANAGGESKDAGTSDRQTSSAGDNRGREKPDKAGDAKDKATEKTSQADRFKAFVNKHGTPKEKDAVAHVTKVQGADQQNDILDSVDVYTDFTGGITGAGQAPARLLASSFADWKHSKNGLVTIYDADGELISNGNF